MGDSPHQLTKRKHDVRRSMMDRNVHGVRRHDNHVFMSFVTRPVIYHENYEQVKTRQIPSVSFRRATCRMFSAANFTDVDDVGGDDDDYDNAISVL